MDYKEKRKARTNWKEWKGDTDEKLTQSERWGEQLSEFEN